MRSRRRGARSLAAVALAGLLGAGCAPTEPLSPEESAAAAARLYRTRCATCHGDAGRGDGPGAGQLAVPPRDLADPAWQASVSDERMRRTIVEGGAAVGLSPLMVRNPDLATRPELLAALVRTVRGFRDEALPPASLPGGG